MASSGVIGRFALCATLLLLLCDTESHAQTCETTIFFGNGILSTEDQANAARDQLLLDLNSELAVQQRGSIEGACVRTSYAVSADSNRVVAGLSDLTEALSQILADSFGIFWRWVSGDARPTNYFEQLVTDVFVGFGNVSYLLNSDLQRHVGTYRAALAAGGNIVVVAHSQGNLFANEAYRVLTTGADGEPPILSSRVSIVAVATPDRVVPDGSDHTTFYGDLILAVGSVFPMLPANTDTAGSRCIPIIGFPQLPGLSPVACHEFLRSYLRGIESKQRIVSAVLRRLELEVPIANDDYYSMLQGDLLDPHGISGILYNDTVPTNFTSVTFLNPPTGFIDSGGGRFTYTPPTGVVGEVQLSYSIHTRTAESLPATIKIQVNQRDPTPVALDNEYTVIQGDLLTVAAPGVLSNDYFPPGATVEFLAPLPASLAARHPDGSFSLNLGSEPTFTGPIVFYYVVHSISGDSNVATIKVQVEPFINNAIRLNWTVQPSGEIISMEVPPWPPGETAFVWQYMQSSRSMQPNTWGASTCDTGTGRIDGVSVFVTPTGLISHNGGMNVLGAAGSQSRGGIGIGRCQSAGYYYLEIALGSNVDKVSYYYELYYNPAGSVLPINNSTATRLNWDVQPDGTVTSMQVPPWLPNGNGFGWQMMLNRMADTANSWGPTSCMGGSGGVAPRSSFQTGTSLLTYYEGMNVFGTTGNDGEMRGGLGTSGCLTPGNYYFGITDMSTRSSDDGLKVTYFYQLYYDGASTVTPVNGTQ